MKDAEAHLLCTNDWMNAHHFIDGVKDQTFCLTLLGEAVLWYQSLEPINVDWQSLQNLFRQPIFQNRQYQRTIISCMEIITNENTETIDAYVSCIGQVPALLDQDSSVGRAADLHAMGPGFSTHS